MTNSELLKLMTSENCRKLREFIKTVPANQRSYINIYWQADCFITKHNITFIKYRFQLFIFLNKINNIRNSYHVIQVEENDLIKILK